MTERKRRLYRAVITALPVLAGRNEGPHGGATVPRQIIRGAWWNEEIVYLAQDHAPYIGDSAEQAKVDPWDAEPTDTRYWATFHVGQSRAFHARANAERRARLWRAHGCTVRVDTSEPIVWTEGEAS